MKFAEICNGTLMKILISPLVKETLPAAESALLDSFAESNLAQSLTRLANSSLALAIVSTPRSGPGNNLQLTLLLDTYIAKKTW